MTAWHERSWLALDFETTGVNPHTDRIVSYACLLVDPAGEVIDGAASIVNAKVAIPAEATAIHGITNKRAEAEGIEVERCLSGIADMIAEHPTTPLVAYNAPFDWTMFLTECERHQVEHLSPAAIIDPLIIDKQIDRYRKGGRKLTAVAEHYGVPLGDDAHGAEADALAAARVMRAIVRRHPDVADRTLSSLMLWQTRIAEDQRLNFVDYMRRNRDPGFDAPAGWPILTGAVA